MGMGTDHGGGDATDPQKHQPKGWEGMEHLAVWTQSGDEDKELVGSSSPLMPLYL